MAIKDGLIAKLKHEAAMTKKFLRKFHWKNASLKPHE